MNTRTLKILAAGYAVKTLLVGLAWLAIPDLPHRAATQARRTWQWLTTDGDPRP